MFYQKIYSKSGQKYGRLRHGSRRSGTQASVAPFSNRQYFVSLIKRTYQKDLSKLRSAAGNDQGISSSGFSAVPLPEFGETFWISE